MAAPASTALLLARVCRTPPRLERSVNVMDLGGNPPPPPVLRRQNAGYYGRIGEPQPLNLLLRFDEAEDDEYIPPPPVLIRQNAAVVPLTPAMRPDPMVAARQPLRKRGRDNDGGEEPPLKRRLDYW